MFLVRPFLLFILIFSVYSVRVRRDVSGDFRIVRGSEVHIRDVPYFAIILKNSIVHCGSTILTKNKVLTAAHCVAENLQVVAGYNKDYDDMQKITVWKMMNHPNYRYISATNFTPSILDYDVAIFYLSHNLLYTEHIQPVKLALERYQVPPTGTKLIAIGAGILKEAGRQNPARVNILYNVTLPVYDFKLCKRAYRRINVKLTELNFCAGYATGRFDVCNGDSGGPLMLDDLQFGIVSFGHGCGRPEFPSVFSTVSRVLNWIQSQKNNSTWIVLTPFATTTLIIIISGLLIIFGYIFAL